MMRPATIVVAVASDNAIGRRGDMLFHIPSDLRHFKAVTLGHPVIMGRKTFESLPKGALPGRRNIVITRNPAYVAPGAETAASLEEALALCSPDEPEPMIIGGGEIYRQAMEIATTIELTEIGAPGPADADTFFPEIDPKIWGERSRSEIITDERSGLPLSFVGLYRKKV